MLGLNPSFPPIPSSGRCSAVPVPHPSSQWPQLSARGTEPSLGRVGAILPQAGNVSEASLCSGQGMNPPCQQLSQIPHSLFAVLCSRIPSLAFINHTGSVLWLPGFVHGALVL